MKSQSLHIPLSPGRRKETRDHCRSRTFRTGVGIDIVFGMARYGCRYHGICKLDIDEEHLSAVSGSGRGKGWLYIPLEGYCLICFDKSSLSLRTRKQQFGRSHFELLTAVPFADLLADYLGCTASLLPGRYPIRDKGAVYTVLFRCALETGQGPEKNIQS